MICTRWFVYIILVLLASPMVLASPPSQPLISPKPLSQGDTIVMVAPSSSLDEQRINLAKKRLEDFGFRVLIPKTLFRRDRFLAGTDEQRADELMSAFENDEVDAIFPGTGGYGATRILDKLDYDVIRNNPKLFIGFSDITALHIAIYQKAGLITYHSPNPQWGLGSDTNLTAFSKSCFFQAVANEEVCKNLFRRSSATKVIDSNNPLIDRNNSDKPLGRPITLSTGTVRGRLVGGNLTVVHALMGTPFEIETDGHILFLEDVGEAPYRIDRMFSTMRLAGKFDRLKGVVLGQFTRRKGEDTSQDEGTIDSVLKDYFSGLGIPVVANFPIGHVRDNATVPIGGIVELDATKQTLQLMP